MDDTCRFELELTEGNNPFPEADVNIDFYDEDGNPITTSNVMARPSSGENIIGTADTHAHLCHNKGSGEVVFNGDAFSPLGIADALNDCTDLHGVNGAYDIWGKAVDGANIIHRDIQILVTGLQVILQTTNRHTINGWSVPIWRGKECWYISA